jgi:hypothetical protein
MTKARTLADFNSVDALTSASDLNASNLVSGTIPNDRYGTPTFNGANLSNVHNTPYFLAYRTGNQEDLPANAWIEVLCNGEDVDSANAYNTTTGRFTPQEAGYYQVQFVGSVINLGGSASAAVAQIMYGIVKNGTGDPVAINFIDDAFNGMQRFTATVSTIVYLNGTTDFVSPHTYVVKPNGSGSYYYDVHGERQYTNFSAFKISE